ncbi:MAG: FkbM family methyltransferase, partial [Candidatus Heimdallarchaeota archaeon]
SILQENIRRNNLDIQALKMAISNKKGTEKLFISEEHSAHSLKIQNVLGDVIDTVEVFVNTLDNTLSDYMDQSMLIKIDVEGLEPKVFEGMKKILEKSNIAIIFEYTPYRYTEQEREFIQEIIARDFRIFNLHDRLKNPVLIDHNKFRNIEYQTNLFLIKNSFAKFENEDPGKPITPGEGKS